MDTAWKASVQCCCVPGRDKQRGCGGQTRPLRGDRGAKTATQPAPGSCSHFTLICTGGSQPGPRVAHAACSPATARRPALALAGIDLLTLRALPTLHIAAPTHLALARPCHHPALCVVATPTADALAVLLTVTPAASGARGEAASKAEAGRVVQVHELRRAGQRVTTRARGPAPWR